jgi:O-6-methylguanine DNA methyltransferase
VAWRCAWFDAQAHRSDSRARAAAPGHPHLALAARELARYWTQPRRSLHRAAGPAGHRFQQAVWQRCWHCLAGALSTYGAIAQQGPARRRARRGRGHRPQPGRRIIVPCHRVVGANGSLTGYAGRAAAQGSAAALEGALV